MAARREFGGGIVALSPEQVTAIEFDIDMAARQTFGHPYIHGLAAEYMVGEANENFAAEFNIDAVYDAKRGCHIPAKAELVHTAILPRSEEIDWLPLPDAAVPPGRYAFAEELRYGVDLSGHQITRKLNHGWYDSKTDSWAMTLAPAPTTRQVKGFAPTQLERALVEKPEQADLDRIYQVLGAFGFSTTQ